MSAPRVLLADDSPTVRALARVELEEAGYEVFEAGNGAEALEAARTQHPDVVLLDIEMPVMDGYETVQALKADPTTAGIPVVFLTGRSGAGDVVRALKLGGHDYLRKPPEPAELLARVNAALRVKVLQDELRSRVDDLDRVSRIDHLTGLHNRRHTEEHLQMLMSAAKRHRYPVAVLVVDVDHFKKVNDALGHHGGDEVLIAVCHRLRAALRTEDVLGRWGGEEFLALLPHTGHAAATILAERLRREVSGTPVAVEEGSIEVSISIGGAVAEAPGGQDLLRMADQELYAAKRAGRNQVRVVLSEP